MNIYLQRHHQPVFKGALGTQGLSANILPGSNRRTDNITLYEGTRGLSSPSASMESWRGHSQLLTAVLPLLIKLSSLLKSFVRTTAVTPVAVEKPDRLVMPAQVDQGSTYRSSRAIGEKPADIWGGFYQTREGNCVTVSAIKAAMMKFGQSPVGIYREIQTTGQGYRVTTRDGAVVTVTHEELRVAAERSGFQGGDAGMLKDANFLYAVSAKRAQMENHEGAWDSFEAGMQSLNNGEGPGAAFKRLGLFGHIRHATMQELANGAIGTLAYDGHSVAVIDGHEERYGAKGLAPPLHRKLVAEYQAIKLI